MSAATTDAKGIVGACPACGQKNRVPYARVGESGQCGRCGATLPPPDAPVDVTNDADLNRLVAESPIPVVVDFWAPWCGPCRMVAPELEKVARSGAGRYLVAKVNTEALPSIAGRLRIHSIPTLAIYERGRETARTTGAMPASSIEAFIRQAKAA